MVLLFISMSLWYKFRNSEIRAMMLLLPLMSLTASICTQEQHTHCTALCRIDCNAIKCSTINSRCFPPFSCHITCSIKDGPLYSKKVFISAISLYNVQGVFSPVVPLLNEQSTCRKNKSRLGSNLKVYLGRSTST